MWVWTGAGVGVDWCMCGCGLVQVGVDGACVSVDWCMWVWTGACVSVDWCMCGCGLVQVWVWTGAGVGVDWCRGECGLLSMAQSCAGLSVRHVYGLRSFFHQLMADPTSELINVKAAIHRCVCV